MAELKLEVGEQALIASRPTELVQIVDLDRNIVRFKSGDPRSVSPAEVGDQLSVETPKRAFDHYTAEEKAEAY